MPGISPIQPYSIPMNLSPNVASWEIDPQRAVLLIHDMQHYFIRPFSEDNTPASALVTNSTRLRHACVLADLQIAYTAQPGNMTVQQRGLLNDFWGPGMEASLQDREVINTLTPDADDWLLTKWRYSAFVKTNLLQRMRSAGRDQLIICGVYAHVGILATAIEAFSYDIQPFVISDATADFTSEDHSMALDYVAKNCAMVITSDEAIDQIEGVV